MDGEFGRESSVEARFPDFAVQEGSLPQTIEGPSFLQNTLEGMKNSFERAKNIGAGAVESVASMPNTAINTMANTRYGRAATATIAAGAVGLSMTAEASSSNNEQELSAQNPATPALLSDNERELAILDCVDSIGEQSTSIRLPRYRAQKKTLRGISSLRLSTTDSPSVYSHDYDGDRTAEPNNCDPLGSRTLKVAHYLKGKLKPNSGWMHMAKRTNEGIIAGLKKAKRVQEAAGHLIRGSFPLRLRRPINCEKGKGKQKWGLKFIEIGKYGYDDGDATTEAGEPKDNGRRTINIGGMIVKVRQTGNYEDGVLKRVMTYVPGHLIDFVNHKGTKTVRGNKNFPYC